MRDTKTIESIAEYYGIKSQLAKTSEECAELIVEIAKAQNDSGDIKHLIEEIADVDIMLKQIVHLLGCDVEVERWKDYKIKRQQSRISEAEKYRKIYEG